MNPLETLKTIIFGAGESVTEETPTGWRSYYKKTEPNIIERIKDYLGEYKPRETITYYNPSVPTETPTLTPTATPTPRVSGYKAQKNIEGFRSEPPEESVMQLIQSSASKYNIHPAILAAILFQESGFNPEAVGDTDPNDIGIAQINLPSHPDVTREQAFDPRFAIPWAAEYLQTSQNQFDDINRAIASYNVGRGGASIEGTEPYGGGPRGQTYLNNVARNLERELIEQLGLKVSESLLSEYY